MRLRIEIETKDRDLELNIFGAEQLRADETSVQISEGISAKYDGTIVRLAEGFPDILQIIIEVGGDIAIGIASGLISAWLYDRLRGRNVERLTIERTEVTFEEGEIRRIVEEKMHRN